MAESIGASAARSDPLRLALGRCSRALGLVAGFGLVINLLFLVVPLYLIQICDRVLASQRLETLLVLTLMAAFALLILGVLETVRGRLLLRIGNWLEQALSADVIRASLGAALAGAEVNAQALRDTQTLRQFISGAARALLDLPWVPLFLVTVWLLHPLLGWVALGTAGVLFLLPALGQVFSQRAARQAIAARLANEGFADQALRNPDAVQAMGMLPSLVEIWKEAEGRVLSLGRKAGDRNAYLIGAVRFARLVAQIAVLGLGAYLVIEGELTGGTMIAASILMGRALMPVEQSVGAWGEIIASRNAYGRLKSLLERLPRRANSMPVVRPEANLAAEGLWYSTGAAPILSAVSFTLDAGRTLAVVGASASGKTTLCRLLVGAAAPSAGRVRLSAADIHTEWPAEQLGAHVGYVPQNVEFFSASVRANIARLATRAEPEAVVSAAVAAGIHEMILALPHGYDTLIGPGGYVLSAGQRQRLALARAIYGQPSLLVLDEPDSNLDATGERCLQAVIQAARAREAAVVFVTHHPRLLELADQILVLERGRVRFCGERDEVLRRLMLARTPPAAPTAISGGPRGSLARPPRVAPAPAANAGAT